MSMDDVMRDMDALERQLEAFNHRLCEGMSELKEHHAAVSPLWQDAMRREYDLKWVPLEEAMERYVEVIGPKYVDVLLVKLRHLRGYLYGAY